MSNKNLISNFLNDSQFLDDNTNPLDNIEDIPAINGISRDCVLVSPMYTILAIIKESRIKRLSDSETACKIAVCLSDIMRLNNCIIKHTKGTIAIEFESIKKTI